MPRQRFGSFEFDSGRLLLFRKGRRQRVQELPLRVLAMLLERPGDIVSHDTFYKTLWPDDHVGLLEDNLYTVVRKLRQALHDSAHDPQYIETVPGRGYRFIAPVVPAGESLHSGSWRHRVTSSRVLMPAIGLVFVAVLGGAWLVDHRQDRVWARQEAATEIKQLNRDFRFIEAFMRAEKALALAPDLPGLEQLKRDASVPVNIQSEPPGATVFFRPYAAPEEAWREIGTTPLEETLLPRGHVHWRAEAEGHVTTEGSFSTKWRRLFIELPSDEEAIETMVWVPRGSIRTEEESVHLDGFWIDQFEVTNRDFARFVAAGGYEDESHWREALDAGRLRWERVQREFRDRTGRPAPAGWRLGRPPDGEEDLPVTGINWYEAASYCRFVGKALPTLYHWRQAAGLEQEIYVDIRRAGNFSGRGPAIPGEHIGISRFGAYDMAGNVKEWIWNASGTQRHIAGGAWDEPEYMYHLPDARAPIERGNTYGVRCARFAEPVVAELLEPVEETYHDFSGYEPVEDDVYEILKRFYAYERGPLNVREKSVEHTDHWRRESVSFDAAYGGERVLAHLYIPKGVEPPYQTVIYVPGVNNVAPGSSDTPVDLAMTDFLVRSGRVLVFPIFKHTYERYQPTWPANVFSTRREIVIEWYQDLARTLDYLETRDDIDHESIAVLAFSLGSTMAPNFAALDDRLGPQIWVAGGMQRWTLNHPPEIFPINFLPRVEVPVLKVVGRDDVLFGPPELSRAPVVDRLGTPPEHRRLVLLEGGHIPEWDQVIAESLDWLDRYLGPVRSAARGTDE
jgi:eukaryotic-like serine/threonine-protein kinase